MESEWLLQFKPRVNHQLTLTLAGAGAQSTLGSKTFLAENYLWKIMKMPVFCVIFAGKIRGIFMMFAGKINKIPEFYVIFATKRPKFCTIIAWKITFPNFLGGTCFPVPSISYAYADIHILVADDRNSNHVLTNFLSSLRPPHLDPLVRDLVVGSLVACPDVLQWYLPTLHHLCLPRPTPGCLAMLQFIRQVEVNIWFCCKFSKDEGKCEHFLFLL